MGNDSSSISDPLSPLLVNPGSRPRFHAMVKPTGAICNSQLCIYSEFCGKGVALEHDGSVYACDHYVYPEYKLGNVTTTHISRMVFSEQQQLFGFAKRDTLPRQCRDCKYLFACWGECPRNRMIRTAAGEPGLNYLCSGLLKFWKHIEPDMPDIIGRVQRGLQNRDRLLDTA